MFLTRGKTFFPKIPTFEIRPYLMSLAEAHWNAHQSQGKLMFLRIPRWIFSPSFSSVPQTIRKIYQRLRASLLKTELETFGLFKPSTKTLDCSGFKKPWNSRLEKLADHCVPPLRIEMFKSCIKMEHYGIPTYLNTGRDPLDIYRDWHYFNKNTCADSWSCGRTSPFLACFVEKHKLTIIEWEKRRFWR